MVDVWRIENPQSIFRRLDEQSAAEDFVNSTYITPAIKTDHAAIELAFTDSYKDVKGPERFSS